ncbi:MULTISPECIES: helix-turn-helix transcriptional regulator [unclassified Novosphingobium]|uniref:helix-turn-helix domain-containing protein n=1 Tax=unclassified Novosphingobium TaxID=2644732 RepID=UPI00135AA41D|nr:MULTISPECIES: helix-turn-helix transcriptional regulator [unclassified Novosphingobium]
MTDTPLRKFLSERQLTAEDFASDKGMSAWSVRHWARGDKVPSLQSQIDIEQATGGAVKPADWLGWTLALNSARQTGAAA